MIDMLFYYIHQPGLLWEGRKWAMVNKQQTPTKHTTEEGWMNGWYVDRNHLFIVLLLSET
jgi:hypothetical protein